MRVVWDSCWRREQVDVQSEVAKTNGLGRNGHIADSFKVKAALQLREMQELEWYFCRGQTAFEHSNFGTALERQRLYSVAKYHQPAIQEICDDDGKVIARERRVTARPTAEVHEPAGYTPQLDTLQRYAHISAVLKQVERRSRRAALAIELLYGDYGARWAAYEPYGRLTSLFHLTAKGQQLIAEARAASTVDIPDRARMEVICFVQRAQPKRERGLALTFCQHQALAIEQEAMQIWRSVYSPRARRPKR